VSGDNQTSTVGQHWLTNPLEVLVTDALGNPVSGVTVNWAPSGDGTANPPSSQTNANGIASTEWTLGTTAGGQTLGASATGAGSVTFNATAEAGAAANIAVESGDGQTGTVGQTLGAPLEVLVTDAFGNAVSGVTVNWAPSGDGTASPTSSQTNASGIASTEWTLGTTAGEQTLDASVTGATPVTFTATAEAGG
jgi:hypothetical protein